MTVGTPEMIATVIYLAYLRNIVICNFHLCSHGGWIPCLINIAPFEVSESEKSDSNSREWFHFF